MTVRESLFSRKFSNSAKFIPQDVLFLKVCEFVKSSLTILSCVDCFKEGILLHSVTGLTLTIYTISKVFSSSVQHVRGIFPLYRHQKSEEKKQDKQEDSVQGMKF